MGMKLKARLYTYGVIMAAAVAVTSTHFLLPVEWEVSPTLVMVLIAVLVYLADRFPIKLSPQADASLFTVPMFTGILLLHPGQAAIASGVGILLSDVLARRPLKAVIFNAPAGVLTAAMSGMVFWTLRGSDAGLSLTSFKVLGAVGAAGLTLELTNLLLVASIVTLQKSEGFWAFWVAAWANETIQELAALTLGFLAAILAIHALWTVALMAIPVALAYFAFHKSVEESRRSAEMAQQNAALASELQTRLNQLEETQTELIMQSEKLSSVGVTAAGVVHEVKNAMTVTAGRAELLLRHSELFLKSERAVDHVKNISDMTFRISSLVQELLAYSRPDNTLEPVQVSDALNVAANLLEKKAMVNNVVIERKFDHTPSVLGISNKLQQVFVNLLMNSVDAMPNGGSIKLRCQLEESQLVVSIKDTGTGISEGDMTHIFEPFFTTKDRGKGTGLGMFVCKKIISDHGGEILVNSEVGLGTEFVIKLPVVEDETTAGDVQPVSEAGHALAESGIGLAAASRATGTA